MDLPTFLIQLLNAVQYGLLLFLVAGGLTLIFGIMGIINLAHGSFYMVGAYLAWSLTAAMGSLWLAIPAGIVLSVLIGMALEWLLIRRLYRLDHLQQVLLTYGLILVVEETRSLLQRHARGNSFFRNVPGRPFVDASEAAGLTMGRWAWASLFVDLNNDGWQDVYVTNGFMTAPDTGDL